MKTNKNQLLLVKKSIKIKKGGVENSNENNQSNDIIISFTSINRFKKSIFNYPNFINLFKIIKQNHYNKNINTNFWYNMLDPLKDKQKEVEINIYSGNQKTGSILRFKNLLIICNVYNNLFEIRFQKFNEDKSHLHIPFPLVNSFEYNKFINESNDINVYDLIDKDILKIFNLQKSWIIKNKKKNFKKSLDQLYFKYDIGLNKWKTNLNQLLILLGFQYSENNSEIFIKPDQLFWNIDINLTKEKNVLTSDKSEIGISAISVKIVNI